MRAWESIPPHEPRDYFFPFLAKITRFIALDRYKENTRQKRNAELVEFSTELEGLLPTTDTTASEIEGRLLSSAISSFLRTKPEEKRNIFIRRYWFMDSVSDIADRFEISEGKVKSVLFRMRNDLQKYLEKEGYIL